MAMFGYGINTNQGPAGISLQGLFLCPDRSVGTDGMMLMLTLLALRQDPLDNSKSHFRIAFLIHNLLIHHLLMSRLAVSRWFS